MNALQSKRKDEAVKVFILNVLEVAMCQNVGTVILMRRAEQIFHSPTDKMIVLIKKPSL